jgi:hypothetical protein
MWGPQTLRSACKSILKHKYCVWEGNKDIWKMLNGKLKGDSSISFENTAVIK